MRLMIHSRHLHALIRLGTEPLRLLCNQFLIFKIINLHGPFHLCQGFRCFGLSLTAAFFQYLVNSRDILCDFLTALTDWAEFILEHIVQELLDRKSTRLNSSHRL